MYSWDNTLFDTLVVPNGVDKDLLVDNIILELSELELLYSDPEFLKFAMGAWSNKELEKWQELYSTTQLDYDPIENYNRTETSTDTETRNLTGTNNQTRNLTGTDKEIRNLSVTNNSTVGVDGEVNNSGSDVVAEKVAGFNSIEPTESKSNTTTYGSKSESDSTTTTEQDGTDTGTVDNERSDAGTVNNNMTDTGTVTNGRSSNVKGNIGVTTSQQMIQQEREVLEFNIYDYIINSFKLRFCVLVW